MMKHTYFTTHWTPEEAHANWMFLNELRDLIWQAYGSEIIEVQQTQCDAEEDTPEETFDDPF